jgi:hypothetical protein
VGRRESSHTNDSSGVEGAFPVRFPIQVSQSRKTSALKGTKIADPLSSGNPAAARVRNPNWHFDFTKDQQQPALKKGQQHLFGKGESKQYLGKNSRIIHNQINRSLEHPELN